LNTFILSESGGSQGLGFAIPSAVVASAYPQLREFGHLHRGVIGVSVQAITPMIAENLELPRSSGVLVSDVDPDSPAATAGVGVGDIVATLNGKTIDSVPLLTVALSTVHSGDTVTLGIVRGTETLSLPIVVAARPHRVDQLSDLGDPEKNAVPKLGVVAVDVAAVPKAVLSELRITTGVLVTARRQDFGDESPLVAGDVIHKVNAFDVRSFDGLQVLIDGFKPNSDVVLQIERDRRLMFVTTTLY
jgi:serine protease Do